MLIDDVFEPGLEKCMVCGFWEERVYAVECEDMNFKYWVCQACAADMEYSEWLRKRDGEEDHDSQ